MGWRRTRNLEPNPWEPGGGRPRVLIEHHDPSIGRAVADLLSAEGYEVATCAGPTEQLGSCPLVVSDVCGRAAEADAVFFGLHVSDEDDRAVLAGLRGHFPDKAVVVEIPPTRVALYAEELVGCFPVTRPLTRRTLLEAFTLALQARGR